MRLLQFSTLAIAALLAGCANHGEPMISQSSRPLVETPQPAQLPNPPAPALKPAQQPAAAAPEAKTLPPSQGVPAAEQETQANAPASPEGQASQSASQEATQPTTAAPSPPSSQEATAQPATAASSPPVPQPAELVGLSQADAGKIFGPPTERKDSPPSQIWTYRSETCDLKLYFYPEVGGSAYRALTYQIDDRGSNDATHHTCLASLAKPRAG